MRRSGRLLIIVGVILGLAAVVLAVFALAGGDDDDGGDQADQPQDITIVQAKNDVDAHTELTADDLEEVIVKDDSVPNLDDVARDIGEVVGFAYEEDLVEGQRVLRSRLEVSGIAEELAPGTRALALEVSDNNTVAGLIRQDDTIDLIYQIDAVLTRVNPTTPLELPDELDLQLDEVVLPPLGEQPDPQPYPYPGEPGSRFLITDASGGNPVSKAVLQNIRVLRVIEPVATEGVGTDELTFLVLEVTAEQAELLHIMQNVGSYQIVLRGTEDSEVADTDGMNLELLVTEYNIPVPKTVRLPEAGAQ